MTEHPNHLYHLYLDRIELRALAELLCEIPDLAEDLSISLTRQSRLSTRGDYRMNRRPSEQPLPYNPAASRAADELHAVLVSWVRLVCEQRGLDYAGSPSTPGLARWLDRNLIALAMTEGAEGAPEEIRTVVQAALGIVCPPAAPIVLDEQKLEQARRHRLNASGIATLAKELGAEYQGLTVRRIQTLRNAGKIAPLPGPWAPGWPELYTVGEVLDEHLAHPMRRRAPAAVNDSN
ncbi:hypothetical protein NONI108955_41390 [Nocardia ninae]|uniref:Uncharacterized protein n=1 Tax=Nocardia ninae NBRC 108245 TaxID=1210091 RepID=A0A511MHY5_9NOCA|nr:hypothetical protein [Nocardia ninae]GEM39526.1 hypothetical protein NN4_40450 [Nocardia ninae NBRC 108245]